MSSTVAQLFEHSSRQTPEGPADPYLLLLKTIDVHTTDVAYVVMRIGEARLSAKYMDYRLSPLLLEDSRIFVEALVSLTSVGGKGLKHLTTQTQAYHFKETGTPQRKMSMREMIAGQKEPRPEAGIPLRDE